MENDQKNLTSNWTYKSGDKVRTGELEKLLEIGMIPGREMFFRLDVDSKTLEFISTDIADSRVIAAYNRRRAHENQANHFGHPLDDFDYKYCNGCKKTKRWEQFTVASYELKKLHSKCKKCLLEEMKVPGRQVKRGR